MRVRGKHEFDEIPEVNSGDKLIGVHADTVDPVVGNDNTQGYYVGYKWVNTSTDTTFHCEDASAGAAVWSEGGGGVIDHGSLTGLIDDDHTQYVIIDGVFSSDPNGILTPSRVGAVIVDTTNDKLWQAVGTTNTDWKEITVGGSLLAEFVANDAMFPPSNSAGGDARNGHAVLAFDTATDESIWFEGILSPDYSGGDILVDVWWTTNGGTISGTNNAARWGVSLESGNGLDLDVTSFGTEATSDDIVVTEGVLVKTTVTLSTAGQKDSISAGDKFRLQLFRRTAVTNDFNADLIVSAVLVRQ
jgi:hypothetical protein